MEDDVESLGSRIEDADELESSSSINNSDENLDDLDAVTKAYRKISTRDSSPYITSGVLCDMILSENLHIFHMEKSSISKPHLSTTSNNQRILYFNTLYVYNKKVPHTMKAMHYCTIEGHRVSPPNLIFLGVVSNKTNPTKTGCYVFDTTMKTVQKCNNNKVITSLINLIICRSCIFCAVTTG